MGNKIQCSVISIKLLGKEWTKEDENNVKYGDVLSVKRPKGYRHFAIYIGDGNVIHYTPKSGISKISGKKKIKSIGSDAFIQEGSMADFLDKSKSYSIIVISENIQERGNVKKTRYTRDLENDINGILEKIPEIHVHTPDETVARAKEKVDTGLGEYKLLKNNCEDFAVWCKTGINISEQVEEVKRSGKALGVVTGVMVIGAALLAASAEKQTDNEDKNDDSDVDVNVSEALAGEPDIEMLTKTDEVLLDAKCTCEVEKDANICEA